MKSNISKIILAAFVFSLMAISAKAQIFVGGITVTNGITNAPVKNAFVIQTNLASSNLAPRNLSVGGIDTNETLFLSYAYTIPGIGGTNLFLVVTTTNTFPASAGWTNGATWITNVPATAFLVPVTPYGQIIVSNLVQNTTNTVQFY